MADVGKRTKRARASLLSQTSTLTGLANRLLFERCLQQEVRNSMNRNRAFAVYMMDLDRFKQVNDRDATETVLYNLTDFQRFAGENLFTLSMWINATYLSEFATKNRNASIQYLTLLALVLAAPLSVQANAHPNVAFVIANSHYDGIAWNELHNTINDAALVTRKMKAAGFPQWVRRSYGAAFGAVAELCRISVGDVFSA